MKNTCPKLSKLLVTIFLLFLYRVSHAHLLSQPTSPIVLAKHFEDTIKTKMDIEDTIFSFVEEMPEYPGGTDAMMKFLMTNFIWKDTDDCLYSRIVITFVVTKNGKIINPKIIRSACANMDQQVMKVIKSFPDWKPGKHNGKPVNVCFTFPVVIELKE